MYLELSIKEARNYGERVVHSGHFADKESEFLAILRERLLKTAPISSIFLNIYRHVG